MESQRLLPNKAFLEFHVWRVFVSVGGQNRTAVRQCRLLRPELQVWENCLLHSYSTYNTYSVRVSICAGCHKEAEVREDQ